MPTATTEAKEAQSIPPHRLAVLDTGGYHLRVWLFDGPATPAALKAAASGALDELQASAASVLVLPNLVARPRVGNGAPAQSARAYLAGPEIGDQVGVYARLQLRSPIERGFITDWAAQTLSWSTTLRRARELQETRQSSQIHSTHAPIKRSRRGAAETSSLRGEEKPAPLQPNRRKSSTRAASEADVGQPWPGPGLEPLLWGRTVLVTEPYFNMPELATAMDTLLFEEYGAAAVLRASPAELAAWCLRVPPAKAVVDVVGEYGGSSSSDLAPSPEPELEPQPGCESANPGQPTRAGGKRKRAAADKAAGAIAKIQSLPETTLVLDCGHSYCHAVPLVRGRVVWGAVKRCVEALPCRAHEY